MYSGSMNISTNPSSMYSEVKFGQVDPKIYSSINLTMSSLSECFEYTPEGFKVPWHDLKRGLTNIGSLAKQGELEVKFDDFTRSLVLSFLEEKDNRKRGKIFVNYSREEIINILSEQGFLRALTKEQLRDTQKLLLMRNGANFSVPGAGKTTTLLAIHTILYYLGIIDFLFVISPINAFLSWEDEIASVFGENKKKIVRLSTDDLKNMHLIEEQKPYLILVNYEKMRKETSHLFSYFQRNKIHLVLDESHRIKAGKNNLSFSQICYLSDLAVRKDILSGTPMPQRIGDINPQMEVLWSEEILDEYNTQNDEELIIKEVNKKLSGLFVRTTKNELGLKRPIIRYKYVEMGHIQNELYSLIKSETKRRLSHLDKISSRYFRQIGASCVRLLQAATNPMLLGTEDKYYEELSQISSESELWQVLNEFSKFEKPAKIEYLKKRVNDILLDGDDNKIVIWSFFIRNIRLLERIFPEYNPVSIFGDVPIGNEDDENSREYKIRKFHNDKTCRLLIANPQAGGEGISLHKVCHHAIYLDRSFNAAHYIQSLDRIHRLGLDKDVNTYIEILVSKDTIDEVVINRLNKKTKTMASALNDNSLLTLAYDPIDMEDQFGLDMIDIDEIQKHLFD